MDRRGASFFRDGDGDEGEAESLGLPESPIGRGSLSPQQAMAALPVVLEALGDAPLWQYAEPDLIERVQLLFRVENQVVAAQVAAVGEAVKRGVLVGSGYKSGGAWLRGLVPLTPQAAAQRAQLAEELARPDLAPTKDAFTGGDIGVGQTAAITRTMCALDQIPDVDPTTWDEAQQLMLGEAARLDARQLAKVGVALRHRLDPDAADRLARDEDAQQHLRQATLSQESSGMWWLTATLPAKDGAVLATALDGLAQPCPAADGEVDPRSRGQRMADALTGLAELSLAQRAGLPGGLPSRHGSPVRMIVTADVQTLLVDPTRKHGQAGAPMAVVETGEPGGWEISPLEAQTLFCDAELVPAVLDGDGRPLDVGDSVYRFPPKIRRAIEIRDRHRTFPNCQAPPAWCHAHHLVAFGRDGRPGGATSEANGTLLCGRHHRHVHATGWTGALVDGHVAWHPPRPGAPPAEPNDHLRQIETALRQLATRWLTRNPHLRDTG
ncbi:MAG: DUF222 domain-containing protein [Actinomycetales bacterium]